MEQIGTSAQAVAVKQKEQGQLSPHQMKDLSEKRQQISEMLLSCYESMNVYGKEPEQLANMNRMFQETLKGYELEHIRKAFLRWVESNKVLPTPHDIIKNIHEIQYSEKIKKEYATPVRQATPQRRKVVQWAYKKWGEFTDSDKQALAAHLESMEGRELENYKKYLINHAGVPREALG